MTGRRLTGRRSLLGAAASTLLIAACAGLPPPPVVDLTIRASGDINPNAAGTPVSVAARVYSLNGRSRFESADVFSLMQREAQVLGPESVGVEEVLIRPGETRKVVITPKAGVRFIGIAVMFRDIDRAQWRVVAPIAESGPTKLALAVRGLNATLVAP